MSDHDLICVCMAVSRGEIRSAVGQGQTTVDSLKTSLGCCTGCGTCELRVRKVVDDEIQAIAAAQAEKPKAA